MATFRAKLLIFAAYFIVSINGMDDDPVLWVHRSQPDWPVRSDHRETSLQPPLTGNNICTKQET